MARKLSGRDAGKLGLDEGYIDRIGNPGEIHLVQYSFPPHNSATYAYPKFKKKQLT